MLIHTFKNGKWEEIQDEISQELPLEIIVRSGPIQRRTSRTLAINMRTKGNDNELVTGFLLTEGIIKSTRDITSIKILDDEDNDNQNRILIDLAIDVVLDDETLLRNCYTNSSCGVCSKTTIESVFQLSPYLLLPKKPKISSNTILEMPKLMLNAQDSFKKTGGIHATALFNLEKQLDLLLVREDVGRHNAMDKAIGAAINLYQPPFSKVAALVSGRASFELVQKCIMVGIPILCAIGAPSTLAIEMADDANMTLIGFLRENRFNVYSGFDRF